MSKTLKQQIRDAADRLEKLCKKAQYDQVTVNYPTTFITWRRLDTPRVPPRPALTLEIEAQEKKNG